MQRPYCRRFVQLETDPCLSEMWMGCFWYRHLADLIVADLDQGTLQDAHLKTNKNEEIPVNIGSRLFA